ncbi:MAG: response regulator [Deltaproteobacteria bacterium]|nr:response regulator [Deltaproteobacteria bacterium]
MKRVLVVEDDPLSLNIVTTFLRAHGYDILVARTGQQALDVFQLDRPDMIVLDVQLPRKNGFEVCFEVKRTEEGKHTPVILMSAVYTDEEHAQRYSEELHADGYFVKPFPMKTLLGRVRDLIGEA